MAKIVSLDTRLMQIHKIKAIRGYKAPRTITGRPSIVAPNRLQREFTVEQAADGNVIPVDEE